MTFLETEELLYFIKINFEKELIKSLNLTKISSPLMVLDETGINDDLNGTEKPISFKINSIKNKKITIVQSLAKWKRLRLKYYDIKPKYGILTDMRAIRPDEKLSPLHSIYVDQWDWEKYLTSKDRTIKFLKDSVNLIYKSIKNTEKNLFKKYSQFIPQLPEHITFIHSEELLHQYPNLDSIQRENKIAHLHKAVFIIGIGNKLSNGLVHDNRAPDYDDWSSLNEEDYFGLNGDIIFWNPVTESAFEISSMGIRVNKESLLKQLNLLNCEDRKDLLFHKLILSNELPLSIGGGIGQSRLCMFLLRKKHIGEVQSSIWPQKTIESCKKENIYLL